MAQEIPDDQAEYHTIDEPEAVRLRDSIPGRETRSELERSLKLLGDDTRMRILSLLQQQELCVHDLSALLEMSQSAVSHQLKQLRNRDLVQRRKDGRVVYYSVNDHQLQTIKQEITRFLDGNA